MRWFSLSTLMKLQKGFRRLPLKRINELLEGKENFGFETTLTTLAYKEFLAKAKEAGYGIRRYYRVIKNLPVFLVLADDWIVIDNTNGTYEWIAQRENNKIKVFNFDLWEKLKQ